MLSVSWPRWIIARFGKKTYYRRRIERLHKPPSLEWLEKRELLTTATPFIVNPSQQQVVPLASPGSSGYTPSQISHAYGFDQITFDNGTVKGDGSGQTIAVVSAYDDPNIVHDLNAFDMQFKLSTAALSVLNQTGGAVLPEADPTGAWESEDALDVEWAHAMAPGANLVLVEANSDNISDLLAAARTAADVPGVSVVSMSWGNAEYQNETNYDNLFTTPAGHTGVTFVASSGDSGAPPIYPAVSPNVLAVGGTTLTVDSQGNWVNETAWGSSGGGISAYEPQPSYQQGVVSQSLTQRTSPDVAYDADSATGFAVYDSYSANGGSGGWTDIAGTSAGAPQWSALVAIANQGRALAGEVALDGPSQTLPLIYKMPSTYFHDIVTGTSTGKPNYSAGPGYDLVTGRGTPRADQVVYYLVGSSTSPQTGGGGGDGQSSGSGTPTNPTDPPGTNLVQDGGFGQTPVGASQLLNPTGSPWLFLGMAGIAGNGGALIDGNAPPPIGNQVAFLYNQSSILQSVSLAAGSYMLSFQASQLDTIPNSQEQIEVLLDGMIVITVKPGLGYATYTGNFTIASPGNYTLQFQGMDPITSNGGAALIDGVTLEGVAPGTPVSPSTPASPPPSLSPSPAPLPSPSPAPSPPSSPPAGASQPSASTGQTSQDNLDPFMQSVISSLNYLLLNDLLVIQAELNQFLQASSPTASIQLVPNLNGLQPLDAFGVLFERWQWVEQSL